MASMSHCCGFVHALQHRLAEVALPKAPLRLGVAFPDISTFLGTASAWRQHPSEGR